VEHERRRSHIAAFVFVAVSLLTLCGCATRPINPPLKYHQASTETQFEKLERNRRNHGDIIVLVFSGGGTRAAAFSGCHYQKHGSEVGFC